MLVPPSSPMARFQARLDHLFQTVRAPDGGEFTYRQVATDIERLVGYKTSSSYLQELRAGLRINPSMKHLHGLCAFFGVPIAYFFDEDLAARVDAQLDLAASLRDQSVRELAIRAAGLSPESIEAITQIVHQARRIEGLDGMGNGAAGSIGPRPALHPRRRGRRARARGDQPLSSDTPHANGTP
jgi:transcriptional regulator with XRE-family HTH domain